MPIHRDQFSRPFWRNGVVGVIVIGSALLFLPSDQHDTHVISTALLLAGVLIITASAVHTIGGLMNFWESDR